MAPKRSEKKSSSTSTSGTATDTPKSRIGWKTGEQLEYMVFQFPDYVTHQNEGTLDRFWPPIYDFWYRSWPINPPPESVKQHGSHENAVMVLRSENNTRIRTWFHNRARPGSKATKADLRLSQSDKRKLAPAQAYCTYAWGSGLREVVIARWEEQKRSYVSADDDDPTPESVDDTPSSGSHIPIDFKLKIAREVYSSLNPEEKKRLDNRREEERNKVYRTIPEITDIGERDQKLLSHQQNQPSVPKSLLRILKNLEVQAGCVAQLFIAHVDPETGKTSCQNFCQGKTEEGLDFSAFCGNEWDDVIEKRFKEWGLRVFGDGGSNRRSKFMLSDKLPDKQEAMPSSSSQSQTSPAAVFEQSIVFPPGIDTTIVGEFEGIEASGVPPPQIFEAMQLVPPQTTIPPPLASQPFVMSFRSPDSEPGFPMHPPTFESPQFVVPQEIFSPPQSVESVKKYPVSISPRVTESPVVTPSLAIKPSRTVTHSQAAVSPMVTEPLLATPSPVLESSQAVTPRQVTISSTVTESLTTPLVEPSQTVTPGQAAVSPMVAGALLATASPILGSSQTVAPHQSNVSSMVTESHLTTPLVESSQTATPGQAAVSPMVAGPPLVTPSPVLGSSQAVTPHHVVAPPTVTVPPSLAVPSSVVESTQTATPQQVVVSQQSAHQRRVIDPPPQVIHGPQTVLRTPGFVEGVTGGSSGTLVTTKSVYKLRDKASVTTPTRIRCDSIEEAPDIILSLSGSGYQPATHSSPLVTIAENDTDISTTPSSTTPSTIPFSDELIIPSPQQSFEELVTTPVEARTSIPTTPSADEFIIPSSQQSLEEPLTIPAEFRTATASSRFRFAPRVIPDYNIDRSDFPSWLLERGRLDFVLSMEAGDIWKKLIITWLRQERRLAFGLNAQLGASLSLKQKPVILGDYFKWHHTPSKGDSVALPEFGDETSDWWASIQPKWRYKNENPTDSKNDYSYILAGGKKGVYLLILCLAWWDQAHGREMEKEKVRRREAARAAGKDDTSLDFGDLHEHEYKWFNIVNDLIFILELAQGWPVPGEGVPHPAVTGPVRTKRAAEQGESSSPRKKKKKS